MPVPMPITARRVAPPFQAKLTLVTKPPAPLGLNRTTILWIAPAARLNEPPETTLNGAVVETVPLSVLSPGFMMVND